MAAVQNPDQPQEMTMSSLRDRGGVRLGPTLYALLGLAVLSAAVWGVFRWQEHRAHVERAQASVSVLDARIAADLVAQDRILNATGPLNRGLDDVTNGMSRIQGVGDIYAVLDALGRLRHAKYRLDRSIADLQHLHPDLEHNRGHMAMFEAYGQSSDAFRDAYSALHGALTLGAQNPFALAAATGNSYALGARYGRATRQYVHTVQDIVNSLDAGITDLRAQARKRHGQLAALEHAAFSTWLARP